MKTSITLQACCLSILLLLVSCDTCIFCSDDEKRGLPPITTEGKGTFGCLVDGKLFTPYGTGVSQFGGNPRMRYTEISGNFNLDMGRSDTKQYMVLRSALKKEGVYNLKSNSSFRLALKKCAYRIDSTQHSQLEILHLDKEADIISGTFEAVFVNKTNCNDTIHVTDGRFDLKYRF